MIDKSIYSPLQSICNTLTKRHKVTLSIKRDDLIHPLISGNKWRKLAHNLAEARHNNTTQLVSFGGAYSNHIHALAAAGQRFGFDTVGIIRGEEDPSNPTIADAKNFGMTIKYVTRKEYKRRHDQDFILQLQQQYPEAMIIPEGGTNLAALKGVSEIIGEISDVNPDFICTPCGSGGTTAGLITSAASTTQIVSIPVLKGSNYLVNEINKLVRQFNITNNNWDFIEGYDFGGYAKVTPELIEFITRFYDETAIKLEPVYSGKMFFAIFDLIKRGYFAPGSRIVAIHTGGLQGINGLKQRKLVAADWLDP